MTTSNDLAGVPCQRWDNRRHSWRRISEGGYNPARYGVAVIDDDTIPKDFVIDHHYSGSYPNAKLRFGLYDLAACDELVGVVVLSRPVTDTVLAKPFPRLTPGGDSMELGRLVLRGEVPANAESDFVAEVFHLAAKNYGVRGIVSFADPQARHDADDNLIKPGHLGIVYQALSGQYVGKSTKRTEHVLRDGTVMSARAEQKIRVQEKGHRYAEQILVDHGAPEMLPGEDPRAWLRTALRAAKSVNVRHYGKHIYLFAIGTKRQRLAARTPLPQLPYPKWSAA